MTARNWKIMFLCIASVIVLIVSFLTVPVIEKYDGVFLGERYFEEMYIDHRSEPYSSYVWYGSDNREWLATYRRDSDLSQTVTSMLVSSYAPLDYFSEGYLAVRETSQAKSMQQRFDVIVDSYNHQSIFNRVWR